MAIKKNTKALNAELGQALFSDMERCEMFFAQHWKGTVAAALAAVVVITAAFAWHTYSSRSAKADSVRLAEATAISEVERELSKSPSAPGADMSRYRLAGMYIESKQYDKALSVLSAIVSGSEADSALRNRARMTEAYVLELTGKLAEAAKKFAMLSSFGDLSASARAEAAYSAGRLFLKLGKKAEAKSALNKVIALEIPAGSQSGGFWKANAVELAQMID